MNLYDNKEDFKDLIISTSENLGLIPAIVEKDYYWEAILIYKNHQMMILFFQSTNIIMIVQ